MGHCRKKLIPGDRREYIAKERRKREIGPVITVLEELEFKKIAAKIASVTKKMNKIVDLAIQSDEHWLMGKMTDLLK